MNAFQPAQAQRWNLFTGFAQAMESPAARAELRGWCGLALLSLAVAGVFALLVALSRVPGVEELAPLPVQFFDRGLVVHVVFSFVVWYLSVMGGLLTVAAHRIGAGRPPGTALGRISLWCGYASAVLLFVPGFMDSGEPSLNNYVPMIAHPLYYAGLAILAVGLGLAVARLLLTIPGRQGPLEPVSVGAVNAAMLFTVAMLCFVIAGTMLADDPLDGAFFENLFWGGGHILQFVNVALMIGAWYVIGGLALETPLVRPNLQSLGHVLLLGAAFLAPLFYILFDGFSVDQNLAFTNLQYAFALPTVIITAFAIQTMVDHRPADGLPWRHPGFLALVTSIFVFAVGGLLGMFVDGADTRTPAHYHGVIGGVNLAFMGLFYCYFLPLMGRDIHQGRAVNLSIWFYAVGQTFHSLGLFLAGGYGAPRKTAGADQGMEALGAQIGLYGMGVGAVVAVLGGIMFIWISGRALIRRT